MSESRERQDGDCEFLDRNFNGLILGETIRKGGKRGPMIAISQTASPVCSATSTVTVNPKYILGGQLESACTGGQCTTCPVHERTVLSRGSVDAANISEEE